MDEMIKYIKEEGAYTALPSGSVLTGKVKGRYFCYLIDSGMAVVYTSKNRKALRIVNSQEIFGLNHLLCPEGDFVIKIIHPSSVYAIPAISLLKMIDNRNQWRSFANHLSNVVYTMSIRTEKDRKMHTAALISDTIQMLQTKDEDVRLTYTVLEYVMDITGLSRSTVVRALEVLRKQNKVEINNGLLINFHL